MTDDNDAKIILDRIAVEDLTDEFHGILAQIVDKANEAIESTENDVNKIREKLAEAKERIEELEKETKDQEEELDKLRSIKKSQIDFDAVERLINFAPGDPGHVYPLHERVAAVLKKANADRDDAITSRNTKWQTTETVAAELDDLKAAIIPELERLEGHEKRLRDIVDGYLGKTKDKGLNALLQTAKEAFSTAS